MLVRAAAQCVRSHSGDDAAWRAGRPHTSVLGTSVRSTAASVPIRCALDGDARGDRVRAARLAERVDLDERPRAQRDRIGEPPAPGTS